MACCQGRGLAPSVAGTRNFGSSKLKLYIKVSISRTPGWDLGEDTPEAIVDLLSMACDLQPLNLADMLLKIFPLLCKSN